MIGTGRLLRQLAFGYPLPDGAVNALDPVLVEAARLGTWNEPLVRRLQAYAKGSKVEFLDIDVDLGHQSQFCHRIYRLCRKIPFGQTMTYGQLAAQAGSPGAARAVGRAMAKNRVPLVIPCHRVVCSGRGLGGFSGPGGVSLKQRLLTLEAGGDSRTGRTGRTGQSG